MGLITRVTKDLQDFALAHRLGKGYPYKCKNLHGHNYGIQVSLEANQLDQYDMAIDFGDIKKAFNGWVQDNWDHACMVNQEDETLLNFLTSEKQRMFVVPKVNQNSTAEWMARFLFETFEVLLEQLKDSNPSLYKGRGLQLVEVKVWETKDSFATWTK